MPVDIIRITAVQSEPIRRVAVHVDPRARLANGARQTQKTTDSILRVPVLVERLPPSAANGPKQTTIIPYQRNAAAAAPMAREVPRLDLVEGPFLRRPAFFVATTTSFFGRSVGRERH